MSKRENYIHLLQDEAFEKYKNGISFQKDLEKSYDDVAYKMKQPDLLGKTVRITPSQFSNVWSLLEILFNQEHMNAVPVYVYEEYYYGAESYGIKNPWIEISAKTIADFTKEELMFVLAREVYKISDGVTKQKTMMEERFKYFKKVSAEAEETAKVSFYHWLRLTNYTADNYGYLACSSIKDSVNAIIKMVLNSITLAEQVNIKQFIEQGSEINKLDDIIYNHTKADEKVPYAPHRIQSLLAYAESERGVNSLIERMG